MRNSRPDSSINCDRNSANSFVSLDTRNYIALSASDRNTILNSRDSRARHRELARLEPLCSPELPQESQKTVDSSYQYHIRKVSLPPLLLEDEKRKVASAKKNNLKSRKRNHQFYHLDKVTRWWTMYSKLKVFCTKTIWRCVRDWWVALTFYKTKKVGSILDKKMAHISKQKVGES